MQELDDHGLLREYAEHNSEDAFAALAARHINKVYSVALRHTHNPGEAEEITQAVFVILAKKAHRLGKCVVLSGWLYQTARLASVTYLRSEIRRTRREQEAHTMQTILNEPDETWAQMSPLLDAAMAGLNETDRHAVVLRFFDGKTMREVGTALGATEDAAKKRLSRALDKLHHFFAKRGVRSTTAIIAGAISSHSVQAAPAALAKSVTAMAIAKGATASASTLTLTKGALKLMAWTKTQTAVVAGAVILLAAGTTIITLKTIHISEPSYHGKSLVALLEQSKNFVFIKATDTPAERRYKDAALQTTYNAVQHIGVSAIPILLQWVENTTNGGGNILAVVCIKKLGPKARMAVPGLIKILDSNNEMARYSALNALQRIGPSANQALPAILNHIQNDPAEWLRSFAVITLANNGIGKANPGAVVPILIECLAPNNKAINRPDTLLALGGLGASARMAIPSILPFLHDPDPAVRKAAVNAIQQIDPLAATKQ